MKRFIAAASIAALAAFTVPASAKTAVWAQDVKGWTVYGDTDTSACWANTVFEDGVSMAVGFHGNGETLWTISGVSAVEGANYNTIVMASTGESGVMTAVGVSSSAVAFIGLNKTAVRALANANQIYLQGLGKYNLRGSKAAMAKAWECFEVLNSF